MSRSLGRPILLDELLSAPTIEVAGTVVQPIARLEGWFVEGAAGAAAIGRLTPATIHVRSGEREYVVPITGGEQVSWRTFLWLGGVVSLVSLVIMLLTALLSRR